MSDQYLYREGGSSFHEGHGRNIIDNKGAEVTGNPLSEAENQRTYFTHSSNMSGQIPSLGEDLVFTEYDEIFGDGDPLSIGNHGRHLSDTHYTGIPSSQTEYHTNFSMDFSGSGFNPHPESNSSFTKNVGGIPPNLSNPDQNCHFGYGLSSSGGTGEQLSDAFGAGILDNAAHNTKAPPYLDMMPQYAVGPQGGYNWREAPQPGNNYNIGPSNSDQPNASSPQPQKHGRTQSSDHDNIGPSDLDQSDELPSQTQKKRERKRWTVAEDGKLWTMLENGIAMKSIAEKLVRTDGCCRCRKRHLGSLPKSEIESRIKAYLQEEADAAIPAPRDVPILRTKHADRISRIDWATPRMKDISCVDLETPGLKEWVAGRVETLRDVKAWGPYMRAYNVAAEDLNQVNNTNLSGKDVQHIHIKSYAWIKHTSTDSRLSQVGTVDNAYKDDGYSRNSN